MHVPDHLFTDAAELTAAAGAVATLAGVAFTSNRRSLIPPPERPRTKHTTLLRSPERPAAQMGTAALVFAACR